MGFAAASDCGLQRSVMDGDDTDGDTDEAADIARPWCGACYNLGAA
jgi:hypothetical protein